MVQAFSPWSSIVRVIIMSMRHLVSFSIWGSVGSDPRRDQAWAHQDLQSVGSPGRHLPTTRGTIVTPAHSAPLCSSGKQTQLHIQTSIYKYTHTNTMSSKPSSYEFWPAKIEKTPIWRCKKQASKRNLPPPSSPNRHFHWYVPAYVGNKVYHQR